MKNLTLLFILFSTSLLMTACGGGSNASSSATDLPRTVQPTTATSSISIGWDIPSTKVNGDPLSLSEIGGYKIYVTKNSSIIPSLPNATITDTGATAHTINELASGTYYIYITTFDVNGDESPYSDYITKTV